MRASDLIKVLQAHVEKHGEDSRVRLMVNETWPFEKRIAGFVAGDELAEFCRGERFDLEYREQYPASTLYIVEGGQVTYGHRAAWDIVRSKQQEE